MNLFQGHLLICLQLQFYPFIYLYLSDSIGLVGLFSISFRFFCPRGILNETGRVVLVSKMQYEFTRILHRAITRMPKTPLYKQWHHRNTNAR